MKFKYFLAAATLSLTTGLVNVACDDDDDDNVVSNQESSDEEEEEDEETDATSVSGEVSGTWTKGNTYNVTGHITVPEGESLTIEEGVEVIFTTEGVGTNHAPVEFSVEGNLYCEGTEDNPILFSIEESNRTADNIFDEDYQWGGIVAYSTCEEMLLNYTIIEYTGGEVIEGSPAASAGVYTAGDDSYPQLTITNPDGNYVITNSTIRYGWSDGIYMLGGNAIIANNIFAGNGYDGAEAVNIKAGCVVDIAQNIMYNPNTNGIKLSSDGQDDITRAQCKAKAYNNTILNAGWRRDGEKGGCIYVEKNAYADVFNNMMVNCKYRAQTPNYKDPNNTDEGYDTNSTIDYNCYVSGTMASDVVWAGELNDDGEWEDGSGITYAYEGYNYDHKNYHTTEYTTNDGTVVPAVDANSVIATEDYLPDPEFVNYDINTAVMSLVEYDDDWDFTPTNIIAGAYSGSASFATPYYTTSGLTVNGETYYSPAVEDSFGFSGND